ncbi:MAG: DUF1573 domain-containing protein [Paludibacter sp.]|nr:DUF1573 domain-containing protein [Paludibacter sp.]
MKKISILFTFMVIALVAAAQPAITFTNTTHDFGDVYVTDGRVSYVFEFTNTGTEPVVISKVNPSCGCTKPDWTQTPIAPGEKGVIIAKYDPSTPTGKAMVFNKTLTVVSNTGKNVVLTIKGNQIPRPTLPAAENKSQVLR